MCRSTTPATTQTPFDSHLLQRRPPDGCCVFTGPLFFGSVHPVLEAFETARDYRSIVISMRGVPLIDAMGSQALAQIVEERRHRGGTVSFSGLQPAVREMFGRTGLLKTIGEENIFWSADQAIVALHGAAGPAEGAATG